MHKYLKIMSNNLTMEICTLKIIPYRKSNTLYLNISGRKRFFFKGRKYFRFRPTLSKIYFNFCEKLSRLIKFCLS